MTTPRPCFSISSGSARAASIISEKPEVMVNERQENSRRHALNRKTLKYGMTIGSS